MPITKDTHLLGVFDYPINNEILSHNRESGTGTIFVMTAAIWKIGERACFLN